MAATSLPAGDAGHAPSTDLPVPELCAAAGFSLAAALVQLWSFPEHSGAYAIFFLLAAALQGLYAPLLLRWPGDRRLLLSGLALALAVPAVHLPEHAAPLLAVAELGLLVSLLSLGGFWRAASRLAIPAAALALGSCLVHTFAGSGFSWEDLPAHAFAALLAGWLATPAAHGVAGWFRGEAGGVPGRAVWALCVAAGYSLLVGEVAAFGVSFSILFLVAAAHGAPWEGWRLSRGQPQVLAVAAGGLVGLVVLLGPSITDWSGTPAAEAASERCTATTADRTYDVAAINVHIPYNRWGDTDPNGMLYVLQQDKGAVRNWSRPLAANPAADSSGNRRLRPRPLVLRANVGECVRVVFTNELDATQGDELPDNPRASIHIQGASYSAQTSDGSSVGYNEDTTVPNAPGQNRITYYWRAPEAEGLYLFKDQGIPAGSEADGGSVAHGLFGALAVEPAGSTWTDPVSGDPLYTGTAGQSGELYVNADIHTPGGSFRETVQISQDEIPGGLGFGFNYGTERQHNRLPRRGPDSVGEETSLSSWVYGDPALIKLASGPGPWLPTPGNTDVEDCGLPESCYVSNVTHAYPNDPTKVRFALAGVKETHVFHMHAHQWRSEPADADSPTIDSQTFGPGETFTADLISGAGSRPGTIGDSIFHCHLYPHFAEGFWALFRVHDVWENGTTTTPDGVKVRPLRALLGRSSPPLPTAGNPGFPRFIPGEFGWRAPQPPGGIFEANGNPDNPRTVAREDLRPATRLVAGGPIDPAKLAVERGVQERHYGGRQPKAGAPLTDPCPSNAREVTYNVSVIQLDLVYNEDGWHDTQGRILVLDRDVEAVLAGREVPEPLFFRVNAGDCINFNLTNRLPNWIGGDAFLKVSQTNMFGEHIHLVKFDVLGSDGSSNGWNYQQAAFSREQMEFNREVLAGTRTCDTGGCRLPDPATWDPTTTSAGLQPGQTISERWFADSELRTVFTHDHHFPAVDQNRGLFGGLIVEPRGMDFRNPRTGDFYQPVNDPAHGGVCGSDCNGEAEGAAMDVIGPGPNDDFREFGLALQDFVSLTRAGGNPANPADTFNPPLAPEDYPNEDPGVMGVNYRNAPFILRQVKDGRRVDPAYTFSSTVWGDPRTPVLQTYAGDPVRIRLIQGSQEEQHLFTLHGIRWRNGSNDPNSPYINAKPVGVSEAFNFEVPRMTCGTNGEPCVGDYLYGGAAVDDQYLGMWGLLRARGQRVPSLLPLPDNVPRSQAASSAPAGTATSGVAPPAANTPGTPCPSGASVRRYSVVALQVPLRYNGAGDNDPYGLMYALERDVAAIRGGDKRPEPLVLRANEGDCIEVRLANRLPRSFLAHNGVQDGDASLPLEPETGTPAGLRVSLHPQLVRYDVRGSDGSAVGYNRDQTVAPGDSTLYRWYADDVSPGELGAINLTDYGDVRGHRHHGLFAALIIEPKGATYHNPFTGDEILSGTSADIRVPGPNNDFREFGLFFQDGMNLRDTNGVPLPDEEDHPPTPGEPVSEPLDAEDRGEKGFNYANVPFEHRMGDDHSADSWAHVFDSRAHGDPRTPTFRAYTGDPVRLRVLQGADKPRQHAFQLSGHAWRPEPNDPDSPLIGTEGGFSVGRVLNIHLPAAGGSEAVPGDYRYGCGVGFRHLSGGMWGILRLYAPPPTRSAMSTTPLGSVDNPRNGAHPLMPLEIRQAATTLSLRSNARAIVYGDSATLSGRLLSNGNPLGNRAVILERRPVGGGRWSVSPVGRLTTRSDGRFTATVKPRENTEYRVRFAGDPRLGLQPSTGSPVRVDVRVKVSTALSATELRVAQRLTISGTVQPGHSGRVNLRVSRGGRVVFQEEVPLRSGRYSSVYRPPRAGTYSVRVNFRSDGDHLGNTGPVHRFEVR
jgi:hypothetical protein